MVLGDNCNLLFNIMFLDQTDNIIYYIMNVLDYDYC